MSWYPLRPFLRCFYAHRDCSPKIAISVVPASLMSPVPHLRRCRRLHLPMFSSPMSPFYHISAAIIVLRLSPSLKFSAIQILSRISTAPPPSPHPPPTPPPLSRCLIIHTPPAPPTPLCLYSPAPRQRPLNLNTARRIFDRPWHPPDIPFRE